ncbi:MAG: hypothetical protein ABI367_09240 [Mucilaginibacter sp.]
MAVTSVSSANTDISVVNGTTTPVLTLDNVNGITKTYYDPTSSIQTQLNSKANQTVFVLIAAANADITTALQTALNTYSEVVIDGSPGQYVINTTITMPSDVQLRGVNNATIACGNSPTGDLVTYMRYFILSNSNNLITNITFKPSATGFPSLASYGAAAIKVTGDHCEVSFCTFQFTFAYDIDTYAVWCGNATSIYNKVLNNKCYTVGIQYAENAASYNTCDSNFIYNASTDGLQGTGNASPSNPCFGNIVTNNIVISAGWSGIEDQQEIIGTIISNNVILNSGQAPGAPALGQGMGISAAGIKTQVTGNEITGFSIYGVESETASGIIIDNNTIKDTTGGQIGIFVNCLTGRSTTDYILAMAITNNNVIGCLTGIGTQGDVNVYVNIQGNTIKDYVGAGISIDTNGADPAINITSNTLILTVPTATGRTAITTYTPSITTIKGYIRVANNNIIYVQSASGGAGTEFGISVSHAGTLIENNVVNCNGVSGTVYTYDGNGNAVDATKFINNKSLGTNAVVSLSTFTNTIFIGNNWPGGDQQILADVVKTATNAAYTITSAGQLVKLPVITANRVVTLPAASNYTGKIIKIWNQNTSASFKWSFSGTVKDATNTTITTLTNTVWYILESDGTNWLKTN